ncbi:hypothetical protein [Listeria cornellensis]|uniref:Mga helix-turn-helix domain-containing protein n=1 Tax=Listeria cornellensis FSL F6-0969 TaxID=1265820 RepID=W7C2F1_9LIST|nr:hypothetical protein [Listeria cornellensis]EUJ31405.1 hypothetical protein PCORN_05066 [Listeria cornellensis FSL F6-0969]
MLDDVDFDSVNKFIQKLERHSNIFFSLSSRLEYAIAIGVSLTRIKQGFLIDIAEEKMDSWADVAAYYKISDLDFSDLEECIGTDLDLADRYMILLVFFLTTFTYVTREQIQFRIQYDEKFRSPRYRLAKDLVGILDNNSLDYDLILVSVLDYLTRFALVDKTNLILDIDFFFHQVLT